MSSIPILARKPIPNNTRLELVELLTGGLSETTIDLGDGVRLSLGEHGQILSICLTSETNVTKDFAICADKHLLSHVEKLANKLGDWRSKTSLAVQ